MRRVAGAFALALGLTAAACGGSPQQEPPPATAAPAADVLVLSNFTLIDGNGGPPVPSSALIATDGRITWVGPAAELKAPAGAAVQNLAGKFVMPGLIDLHTHVSKSDISCRIRSSSSRARGSTRISGSMRARHHVGRLAGHRPSRSSTTMRAEQRNGRPTSRASLPPAAGSR